MQNGRFPCKIVLRLKKVCYRVSLCEKCQRQNYKAFIGLSIRVEIISGGSPILAKIWQILTHPLTKQNGTDIGDLKRLERRI